MKQKKYQDAIVDKVKKVLEGMDYQSDFTLYIKSKPEEVTTIRYEVTEYIVPKEGEAE